MGASIYPTKGQFIPGEEITLCLDRAELNADNAIIQVYNLGRIVKEIKAALKDSITHISFFMPQADFKGYGVKAELLNNDRCAAQIYSAFDISVPGRVIRYGFLSDFGTGDGDDTDVSAMAKYHINTVQFYDWSYRPDKLVASQEVYTDLMGKENRKSIVKKKIEQCRSHGMRAVGYGAVYAASKEYRDAHPGESLFSGNKPLCFIDKFYIMNISRNCPWHDHIINQYREAAEFGLDGIHMDTYGFPKTALNNEGGEVYLEEHFDNLIEDTKQALSEVTKDPCLIFNNVGAWPVEQTKYAPQECVYIEVWPPLDSYYHLKQLILDAKRSGKPVVLAAYPAPFRTDTPQKALECELLCSLAVNLNGATQLFVGEENAVVTQGYYADYTLLNETQINWIKEYQDFFAQYQELLYNENMQDVSLTHIGWDNTEYECDTPFSVTGEKDKLWLNIKESKQRKMIAFINLCGNDGKWNEGKNEPRELTDVVMRIQTLKGVKEVWYASPDTGGGIAKKLSYKQTKTDRGEVIEITIPVILRGGIVWAEV